MNYSTPKILISECLGFSACRYDGQMLPNKFVNILKNYCEFVTVCPEESIGLGTPRDTIRIIRNIKNEYELFQPATKNILTDKINSFSNSFLSKMPNIDAFLLKSASPSCGIRGIPIYVNDQKIPEKRNGFFAEKINEHFPNAPVEDEGRLNNYHIRENYLTRIFTLASFRSLERSIKSLVKFQSINKYLFMTLHQKYTTQLGQIVANHEKRSVDEVFFAYKNILVIMLNERLQKKRTVNALQHILGYFSKELSKSERDHFLDLLQSYKSGKEYLFTINQLLWSWILRYNQTYLKQQTFFNPYPKELMDGVNYSGRLAN